MSREILELAAKAAEWNTRPWTWSERANAFRYRVGGDWVEWNPSDNNDDAFGLMVALKLKLEFGSDFVSVGKSQERGEWHLVREFGVDLSTVRRAIVRAAAEIGKQQETPHE